MAKNKATEPRTWISADALPRRTLEQALRVANVLHETFAGKSATREQLAQALDIGVQSPNTKYLFGAAEAYGLVGREADTLIMSETGRKIVAPTYDGEDVEGKVKALLTPAILSKFYSDYDGYPLPSSVHLPNVLESKYQIPRDRVQEAIDILTENARFAGVLVAGVGGEHSRILLSRDSGAVQRLKQEPVHTNDAAAVMNDEQSPGDWETVCFYITPIGDEGSESRRHADMMLKHLIEPVFQDLSFRVVRADKIERSGLISQQIFEHLARARICVADLSFSNPNAFYELGVRHMTRQPAIQIIRKGDKIPFDVSQGRTITIDTSDVYTVMDRLQSARRELTEHVKAILSGKTGEPSETSPVDLYLPGLKVQLPS